MTPAAYGHEDSAVRSGKVPRGRCLSRFSSDRGVLLWRRRLWHRLLLVRSCVNRSARQQRNNQDCQRRTHIGRNARNVSYEPIGDRRKNIGTDCSDHGFQVKKWVHSILLLRSIEDPRVQEIITEGRVCRGFGGNVLFLEKARLRGRPPILNRSACPSASRLRLARESGCHRAAGQSFSETGSSCSLRHPRNRDPYQGPKPRRTGRLLLADFRNYRAAPC